MFSVLMFVVGIQMMIMLLASLYRIVDLWYRFADFVVGTVIRIVTLVGINVLLVKLLPSDAQPAFIWGQVTYLLLHVSLFWFARAGIWILEKKNQETSDELP